MSPLAVNLREGDLSKIRVMKELVFNIPAIKRGSYPDTQAPCDGQRLWGVFERLCSLLVGEGRGWNVCGQKRVFL
jgi:hypothetical protein